jgi:hypothetical protein
MIPYLSKKGKKLIPFLVITLAEVRRNESTWLDVSIGKRIFIS